MQPENPFTGKPLRCFYDQTASKWWFSAVDICAILTDSDYETARLYWKQLKNKLTRRKNQLVAKSNQLKMPAPDGKYYFTDMLDIKEIIYLIQIVPSHKAEPYRLWLADVVASNTTVESLLVETGAEYAKQIDRHARSTGKPYELQIVTKGDLVR